MTIADVHAILGGSQEWRKLLEANSQRSRVT